MLIDINSESVLELDDSSNCNGIDFNLGETQPLECTSLSGSAGDEEIECIRDGCAVPGLEGGFSKSIEGEIIDSSL